MIKNTLGKSFGPVGSAAGLFVFIAGLVIIFISPLGILLLILGGFLGFSRSVTRIDFERKRIRFSTDVFGLIPVGKWIDVQPGAYLELEKKSKTWRSYSRSNRSLNIADTAYWVYLCKPDNKKVMPIMRTRKYQSAREAKEILSLKLGLTNNLAAPTI